MNIFLMSIPDFADPQIWLSLLTLTFLEIVLGVDNIIFISIVAGKLPHHQQKQARTLGLTLALFFRVALLLGITWIITLTDPVFSIGFLQEEGHSMGISVKDLILIGGGLFLLFKSTSEIHNKLEGEDEDLKVSQKNAIAAVIVQIVLVDMVFSFDSILTAIGLSNEVIIMIIAVVISIFVMMRYAGEISHFINTHPTMQMLALSFLILIGVMLVAEGFHQHVSKGYIYFAIAFSLGVELLNLRLRKRQKKKQKAVQLHGLHEEAVKEGVI